jgi:hypothetical protein
MSKAPSPQELANFLRMRWSERGIVLSHGEHIGLQISEVVEESVRRNAALETPFVDTWVAILDEFISWFFSLFTVVYGSGKRKRKFTHSEKSIVMILSKIIGDSTAIRHLIILGFDTSARTLLRSTAEYMELLVAILNEPKLSSEFAKSDTPAEAKKFWEAHLASGKIRRKMHSAWAKLLDREESGDAAQWFADWGYSSNDILSAMIHPSIGGGMFTLIPSKIKYEPEENWLGILGDKSESSVGTIHIYASFMFAILILHRDFPFNGYNKYFQVKMRYNDNDEMHRHVKIGRDILAGLILSLGTDNNRPHLFPEIDMSIWENS